MVRTKLQTLTAGVLAVALLAGAGGLLTYRTLGAEDKKATPEAAKNDKAKSDQEKLQGTWIAQSGEKDGKKLDEFQLKNWEKMIFADGKYTREGTEKSEGNFTIYPDRTPKEIDLELNSHLFVGIYELKGDVLKVVLKLAGRPTKFESKGGTLIVFKKEK